MLKYKIEHIDSYSDQDNMELGLYLGNDIIGLVQYTLYGEDLTISDILVRPEYRRKGYGSRMVKYIKTKHPEFKYKPSYKTDLGSKFKHKDIKGDLSKVNETKKFIKKLLNDKIKKSSFKNKRLNEIKNISTLKLLIEKKIKVGDNLTKKLNKIDSNLSKNILNFLNSDDIKDSANVEYVDYDKKNEKLFTVGYTDRMGNNKQNLLKVNKLLKYLGGNINNIKDYEVEELINNLKKGDTSDLKLFKGDDILKIYHCDNYDEGETMGSCMRYDYAQSYLKIYTDNPNDVNVLALINPENGKVRGRALIWYMDNGNYFMDRVYVTNSKYNVEFNNYAEDNNIERGSPSSQVTLTNGGEYDEYPYMDTFKHYTPEDGVLSDSEGELELQDTNGGSDSGEWSEFHEERIPSEDACYVEHEGSFVYCEDTVMSYDESEILHVHSNEVVKLTDGEYVDGFALSSECEETYDGQTVLSDEANYLDNGVHIGEYALDEETVLTFQDEYILISEAIKITNGEWENKYVLEDEAYEVISDFTDTDGLDFNEGDIITKYDANTLSKLGAKIKEFN